jgi:hypothetical protein
VRPLIGAVTTVPAPDLEIRMHLRSSALAAAICVLAGAAPAAAADPALTVPKTRLDAALHCHGKLQSARRQPIMLVIGMGATGDEAYAIGTGSFDASSTRCARSTKALLHAHRVRSRTLEVNRLEPRVLTLTG